MKACFCYIYLKFKWQAVKYNSPKKKVSNICYNGIAKHQKQEEGNLWKL